MAAQLTMMDNVKITFSESKDGIINDIKYKHISIKMKYLDGTIGPLIIPLKGCYFFGRKINEKYGGYSIPIVVKDEFCKDIQRYISSV